VKCRTLEGSTYFGDVPPPRCEIQGEFSDAPPPPTVVGISEASTASADPERTLAALQQNAEAVREFRKQVPAVRVVGDEVYENDGFVLGKIANGADFTVYNVRICASRYCEAATPRTLLAGDHGSFRFPAEVRRDVGSMAVRWDVQAR
jgi:hypothetical protein